MKFFIRFIRVTSIIFLLLFFRIAESESRPIYASILIDAVSGEVLHEINPDILAAPASLVKMMTLYLLFEAIDNNHLSFSHLVTASTYASSAPSSKLGLRAGQKINILTAIHSLVVKSANDVAIVIAEALAATEKDFAVLMNRKAKRLGLYNTHFVNASGLYHENQYTTARDMSLLSLSLLRDFPHHYHFFSTLSFTWRGKTYKSHNHLLKDSSFIDGIKTGYVSLSGYNLASSGYRQENRVIGVILGSKSRYARDLNMRLLIDNGLSFLEGQASMGLRQWKIKVGEFLSSYRAAKIASYVANKLKILLPEDIKDDIVAKWPRQRNLYLALIGGFDKVGAVRACDYLIDTGLKCSALFYPD